MKKAKGIDMANVKVLSCPFCGNKPEVDNTDPNFSKMPRVFWVSCSVCSACGPHEDELGQFKHPLAAIAGWNSRITQGQVRTLQIGEPKSWQQIMELKENRKKG